jgi:ubiquinone/menaquinone biosynthesis C-methylase UbiE
MGEKDKRVCPVERAGTLDNRFRRWVQNPQNILRPYIEEGMTVVDLGCGPGFFTLDMAQMVGQTGRVFACDLQDGMLQKLKLKVHGTMLDERITLHQCDENKIGILEMVDFILAFYMIHEITHHHDLFLEIASILKPHGQILIVEPPFHVSKSAFESTISKAQKAGLKLIERPKVLFSKTAVLKKGNHDPILAEIT